MMVGSGCTMIEEFSWSSDATPSMTRPILMSEADIWEVEFTVGARQVIREALTTVQGCRQKTRRKNVKLQEKIIDAF